MLRTVLFWGLGLLALLILLGFVLPDHVRVERETSVNAAPEDVFALVADFEEWEKWSPWADIDPDAEYELTGEGLGQRMTWKSDHPDVGSGSQEITVYEPPSRLVTRLDFGDMGGGVAEFAITPDGDGSKVVWSLETNMREGVPVHMQPMSTYMGFFMDGWVGKDYEKGLANLKRVAEAG